MTAIGAFGIGEVLKAASHTIAASCNAEVLVTRSGA
jgi:hypothetical protein